MVNILNYRFGEYQVHESFSRKYLRLSSTLINLGYIEMHRYNYKLDECFREYSYGDIETAYSKLIHIEKSLFNNNFFKKEL